MARWAWVRKGVRQGMGLQVHQMQAQLTLLGPLATAGWQTVAQWAWAHKGVRQGMGLQVHPTQAPQLALIRVWVAVGRPTVVAQQAQGCKGVLLVGLQAQRAALVQQALRVPQAAQQAAAQGMWVHKGVLAAGLQAQLTLTQQVRRVHQAMEPVGRAAAQRAWVQGVRQGMGQQVQQVEVLLALTVCLAVVGMVGPQGTQHSWGHKGVPTVGLEAQQVVAQLVVLQAQQMVARQAVRVL